MRKNAFSLVEALIAAAIVAIGLTAAASLVGALMGSGLALFSLRILLT